MHPIHSGGGSYGHWFIVDKRGRLVACDLHESEAKRMVRGTSNRARRY